MSTSNGQMRYKLTLPANFTERMIAWMRSAHEKGILKVVQADALQMEDQLYYEPLSFGDPLYDFKNAKLKLMRGRSKYFEVIYAVHFEQPYVFVRSIELRHDTPLGQAADQNP